MVVLEAFFSVSGKKRKEYVRIYHKRRKVSFVYARYTLKNHFGNDRKREVQSLLSSLFFRYAAPRARSEIRVNEVLRDA